MSDQKAFPKQIFVTREEPGTKDEYLQVSDGDSAEEALTSTEATRVATYELKEVKEGKLEPVFNTIVG